MMLDLLPSIDGFIKKATGHDWSADLTIEPVAKQAARVLLTLWYENPAMIGNTNSLDFGLTAALVQLQAASKILTFIGRSGTGACTLLGARVGDVVAGLVAIAGSSGSATSSFESVITKADEIQQTSASDLSAITYKLRLAAPVTL